MFNKYLRGELIGKPIPGAVSRVILDSITQKNICDHALLKQYDITENEIIGLRSEYLDQASKYKIVKKNPRHYLFYQILKEQYPEISWRFFIDDLGKSQVASNFPLVDSMRPSTLMMLLGRVRLIEINALFEKYPFIRSIPQEQLKLIESLFQEVKAVYPTEKHMQQILDWISLLQRGEDGSVFINICPDYAVEPTGENERPYRHTFASLGDGVGQIAKRITKTLPAIVKFFNALHIKPTITVGIGDFEAFSAATLKQVGVTEKEFLSRVSSSLAKFKLACEPILVKTIFISELCGGKQKWLSLVEKIRAGFHENNFGNAGVDTTTLIDIAIRRSCLYSRWYGRQDSIEAYLPIATYQAAEYAAIGSCVTENYDNCLVIGADSALFGDFYSYIEAIPTLYLRRFYY